MDQESAMNYYYWQVAVKKKGWKPLIEQHLLFFCVGWFARTNSSNWNPVPRPKFSQKVHFVDFHR